MTVLQRVPVDQITDRAGSVTFVRTVLTIIAAVLFAIGWLFSRGWLAIVWCAMAVRIGWEAGRETVSSDEAEE